MMLVYVCIYMKFSLDRVLIIHIHILVLLNWNFIFFCQCLLVFILYVVLWWFRQWSADKKGSINSFHMRTFSTNTYICVFKQMSTIIKDAGFWEYLIWKLKKVLLLSKQNIFFQLFLKNIFILYRTDSGLFPHYRCIALLLKSL